MIIVIQCAASKNPAAGYFITNTGKPVMFVADPQAAPDARDRVYARPDDRLESGATWRGMLLKYNEHPDLNPFGLFRAYELYDNKTYKRLVDRFDLPNVYILSAGWGLIRADFLTPQYDITFSMSAEPYKRRGKRDRYDDFRMLPEDPTDVVFIGGKDYLPLFCTLTSDVRGSKTVFYNSGNLPTAHGCQLRRFETTTRTNWHYECANALIDGSLKVSSRG